MLRIFGAAAAALSLAACGGGETEAPAETPAPEAAEPTSADILDTVLAGDHRTEGERARDQYRNPKETLLFFGVEPDMTVVEIYPGGGWYTQVIAPYLKQGGGTFYAAGLTPNPENERVQKALAAFDEKYVQNPDVYGTVIMTDMNGEIAPAGSADAVLTFRNVHNWQMGGRADKMFASFYTALKPGGVLGVVEHRADGAELPRDGTSGYAYTDDTIALAEAAGFMLDQSSEINANAADTKDHPFGVWTLKPSRRSSEIRGQENPDFDRAKYDAIGESDRMTLRFVKPEAIEEALYE